MPSLCSAVVRLKAKCWDFVTYPEQVFELAKSNKDSEIQKFVKAPHLTLTFKMLKMNQKTWLDEKGYSQDRQIVSSKPLSLLKYLLFYVTAKIQIIYVNKTQKTQMYVCT